MAVEAKLKLYAPPLAIDIQSFLLELRLWLQNNLLH